MLVLAFNFLGLELVAKRSPTTTTTTTTITTPTTTTTATNVAHVAHQQQKTSVKTEAYTIILKGFTRNNEHQNPVCSDPPHVLFWRNLYILGGFQSHMATIGYPQSSSKYIQIIQLLDWDFPMKSTIHFKDCYGNTLIKLLGYRPWNP